MSAIAFLAGLGAGYLDGEERKSERARRDRMDQIQIDEAEARKQERAGIAADRAALRAAAAPVAVEQTGGLPATMDNRDVGQPGEAPVAPVSYRVGSQTFAQRGLADEAAAVQQRRNLSAEITRQNPVAGQQFDQAEKGAKLTDMQIQEALRKAKEEGAGRAMNMALEGRSPQEIMAEFNARGATKLVDLQVQPFETTHPVLGKTRSAKLVGKMEDGRTFEVPDAQAALFNMFSAEKRFGMLAGARKEETDQRNADRDFNLRERQVNAALANDQARLNFERQRLSMEGARMQVAKAAADAEAKIPPAVKTQFASYDKELNTIGAAMAKAQAEGTFDPASPGAQALMLRQRLLMDKTEELLAPYLANTKAGGGAPKPGSDPLGVFADKPAAGQPAAKVAQPAAAPTAASPGIGATIADMARRGIGAVSAASTQAQAQGAQYQAIANRVREAMAGGAPLTPQEVAAARRFGIAVPTR